MYEDIKCENFYYGLSGICSSASSSFLSYRITVIHNTLSVAWLVESDSLVSGV